MISINIHSVTKLVAFPLVAWSGYEMASMYYGVILLPVAIVLSTVIYLVAYDLLFRILSPEGESGPTSRHKTNSELNGWSSLLIRIVAYRVVESHPDNFIRSNYSYCYEKDNVGFSQTVLC